MYFDARVALWNIEAYSTNLIHISSRKTISNAPKNITEFYIAPIDYVLNFFQKKIGDRRGGVCLRLHARSQSADVIPSLPYSIQSVEYLFWFRFSIEFYAARKIRQKLQKLAKTWIYLTPYVCIERIFDSHSCTAKYFWKKVLQKLVADIFTLLLTPFTLKLVNYSRHSDSLKNVWKR